MSELFSLYGKIKVDNTDANTAIDETIAKSEQLQKTLSSTNTSGSKQPSTSTSGTSQNTNSSTQSGKKNEPVEQTAADAAKMGFFYKAGQFAKDFVLEGFKFTQDMEKNNALISSYMNGDRKRTQSFLDNLIKYDVDSPYALDGLLQNAVTLLGSGKLSDKETLDVIKRFGEVAVGDQNKLTGLIYNFRQVLDKGRMDGREQLDFANRGFSVSTFLSEMLGISTEKVSEMVSKGQANGELIMKALEYATNPGGIFHGKIDAIMQTGYGQTEKLKSNWQLFQGKTTEKTYNTASSLLPAANAIVETATENVPESKVVLNAIGTAGLYNALKLSSPVLSKLFPSFAKGLSSIKGVSLKEFIAKHPALAAYYGVFQFIDYMDDKLAEADKNSVFSTGDAESILGVGDGKYSGWLGELFELPKETAVKQEIYSDEEIKKDARTKLWNTLLKLGGKEPVDREKTPYSNNSVFFAGGTGYEEEKEFDGKGGKFGGEIVETPTLLEKWFSQDQETIVKFNKDSLYKTMPTIPGIPSSNAVQSEQVSRLEGLVSGLQGKMDTMNSLLSTIAANSTKPMMLDTGIIVGAVNAELGNIVNQNERG